VIPQVKFGRSNEDSEPLLPRREFLDNMLVGPLASSLEGVAPAPAPIASQAPIDLPAIKP